MAKILAPNKSYTGISASVAFCNGEGYTKNPYLIEWFKNHGYKVVEEESNGLDKKEETSTDDASYLKEMTLDELKLYAEEKGIDIGNATSRDGILKKIKNAESTE